MSPTPPPPPPSVTMEKGAVPVTSSKKWSLKKKLLLGAVIALVVIGLAVGLGVGLTVGRDKSGDEGESGGGGENNGGGNAGARNETWQPPVAAQWQIQLVKPLDLDKDLIPGIDIYDIDMFDNPQSTIDALHAQGKKVICYFSGGSYENWRSDAKDFKDDDLGKPLDGWEGEKWLKLSSDNVRNIMKKRIQLAASKGCDAIDPDNVDGYQNDNGLGLKPADSVSFMKFLSSQAATFNMSTGLKNAGSIIEDVLPDVHFSVNEQCIQYAECDTFAPFIRDKKPVFNIEYPAEMETDSTEKDICSGKGNADDSEGFSIVIKNLKLDKKVEYCNGKVYQ